MDCINLRERFGDRYKVTYEESYYAQHGKRGRAVDPWLMIIPCEHGHIYPHGGDLLAFATDKRGPLAKKLCRLKFATTHQDGDDGVNIVFPAGRFEEVARIVQPKPKRRLSEEHRRKLAEAARRYHFPRGSGASNSSLESPPAPIPV